MILQKRPKNKKKIKILTKNRLHYYYYKRRVNPFKHQETSQRQ